MKNKKGFTLIELLAVIVVLAIIALIATPIVMNTIKNAKKGAAERTVDNYIKQVETAVAESRIDGTKIPNGTYNIQPDGNLCPTSGCGENDKNKITIDMSGTKPSGGTIKISNGEVSQDKSNVKIGDYVVSYDKDNNKQQAQELYKGILCTKASGVDLNNLTYGNEFTCELGDNDKKTFYVLETSGDDVSLIMNANVDSNGKAITASNIPEDKGKVAWSSDGKNHSDEDEEAQAITAGAYLLSSTRNWSKLIQLQIKLPTYSQTSRVSTWLCDYFDGAINSVPGVQAYWTSSTGYGDQAFAVYNFSGGCACGVLPVATPLGVRPVITISKSNLS